MGRLKNARSDHITRWVLPASSRLLIKGACGKAPTKSLKEMVNIEMGQSPTGDSCNDDGDGVLLIGGPSDLGLKYPEATRWTNSPTKLCKDGDIIICVRATIGEPRWSDGIYCLGRGVAGLRPFDENLDPKFLFRIVEGNEDWLRSKGTGTTFRTISKKHIAEIKIPIIPVHEQRQISSFLDWLEHNSESRPDFQKAPQLPDKLSKQRRIVVRIEELAAKIDEAQRLRRQAAEEAEALVSSSLSNIFDCNVSDRLPDGGKWKSLSDLILNKNQGMTTGPFGTLLQKSEILEEGVPILGIANVQANRFIPGFVDYVSPQKADFLSSYRLECGDIVVARSGTVGRSCVVPQGLDPAPIMSTNLIRIRLNTKKFLPELLCMLLNGSRLVERHKDSECRGSSRSFFTQKILSKLQLPTHPLDEQRRIVAHLDELQAKVDALKKYQARTGEELDALLPSVLDRAFKGEL